MGAGWASAPTSSPGTSLRRPWPGSGTSGSYGEGVVALLVALSLLAPPKPAIVWKPIPFGAQRKTEMAAYARRHYGIRTWRLTPPGVIVEHYTASDSFSSAYNPFAADVADSELHELPGTCAHFVID